MINKNITSRERILLVLNHNKPDKVPLDMGGITTGIHRDAYKNLLDYLGVKEEIKIIDPVQQIVQTSEKILNYFSVDTRRIQIEIINPQVKVNDIKPGYEGFKDKWGVVWGARKSEKSPLYYDIIESPLANFKEKDLDRYDWPELPDKDQLEKLKKYAEKIKLKDDYAFVSGVYGSIWEISWAMRGFEKFFMDLIDNASFAHKLLDIITQYWLDYGEILFRELGDFFDVVHAGDDIGTQKSPMISLKTFKEFLIPRYKLIYDFIHKKTKAKIFYHSCGSIAPFLPDLINVGVEILNPVQTSAYNMDAEFLKETFGNCIVFWGGGVDNSRILPYGSQTEVRDDVKKRLKIFMTGGGYVFSTIHNIQPDVPAENIIAMWEALQEYGVY